MAIKRSLKLVMAGLSLCLFAEVAHASPILSIQPGTTSVASGGVFSLNVNVSSVTDLFAYQFDLGFSPAVLSALSITEGTMLPGGGTAFFIPGTIDNSAGLISFTADSLIGSLSGVNGSGTLAQVQFKALNAGTSSIGISNVSLLDSSLNSIDLTVNDGNVNVAPVSEPSTFLLLGFAIMSFAVAYQRRCATH